MHRLVWLWWGDSSLFAIVFTNTVTSLRGSEMLL